MGCQTKSDLNVLGGGESLAVFSAQSPEFSSLQVCQFSATLIRIPPLTRNCFSLFLLDTLSDFLQPLLSFISEVMVIVSPGLIFSLISSFEIFFTKISPQFIGVLQQFLAHKNSKMSQ